MYILFKTSQKLNNIPDWFNIVLHRGKHDVRERKYTRWKPQENRTMFVTCMYNLYMHVTSMYNYVAEITLHTKTKLCRTWSIFILVYKTVRSNFSKHLRNCVACDTILYYFNKQKIKECDLISYINATLCDTISRPSIWNCVARSNFIYLYILFKNATQFLPVCTWPYHQSAKNDRLDHYSLQRWGLW